MFRNKLLWILLAVVAILLIIAVVAVLAYVALNRQGDASADWQDPIQEIIPDLIAPDLALYPLAGATELDAIDAAIANGDLETAYATIVFGVQPTDSQRIGRLILLGDGFGQAEQGDRASLVYGQVYETAVLSPALNDPIRTDALLAAGHGWAALGRASEALDAYSQVYEIALGSQHLQMANRRQLLSSLEVAYYEMDELELAQQCREKIIELDQSSSPHAPSAQGDLTGVPIHLEDVTSPEVGALEEARRQAAYTLTEILAGGGEPSPGLTANLQHALLAEDAAKMGLYGEMLEGTTQPGRRIDVHWHLIRWLLLKYKVASLGFGLSLVPEWEAQAADIRSSLSKAYEDLFFDYEDLVTALPDASLVGPGTYATRREVNLEGRLGRYPNYPAEGLADKLQDAVVALISAGYMDELFVDRATGDESLHFFFSPADRYGVAP